MTTLVWRILSVVWMLLSLVESSLSDSGGGDGWQINSRPRLFLEMSSSSSSSSSSADFASFVGNTTITDYFRVMLSVNDDEYLLIGGRNVLYKLELRDDLRLRQKLEWHSDEKVKEACMVKGKTVRECQNYVSILAQYSTDRNRYLLCGTNAFKPMCREYVDERGVYVKTDDKERRGLGLCPYSPDHNSTAVLVGDELFSGTVADHAGVDPIIFRAPQRTRQYDSTQLNSPDFVGSFAHQDFVYFFFREGAVEYINCGKAVFSRVARVCKNDSGGPGKYKHFWTSFLKTRLNCSVPGEYPFYFDEIQGVTDLIEGYYGIDGDNESRKEHIIYATFTTPTNSIGGSAVCAFRLGDITDAFNGRFKEQRDTSANWLPVPENDVPQPRPGTCLNDSKPLGDVTMNFIKTHSLMDETVSPFFGAPVVIRTGLVYRFTSLAVDPQISTTEGKQYDVVFIGTTDGRVIKAVNALAADSTSKVDSVVIEELKVFNEPIVITQLKVVGGGKEGGRSLGKIVVMTDDEIRSFPVQRCDRASTCPECVALRDPYCAWDVRSARCGSGDWTKNMASSFIQSVTTGEHPHCPPKNQESLMNRHENALFDSWNDVNPVGLVINIVNREKGSFTNKAQDEGRTVTRNSNAPGVQVVESSAVLFSLETLIITVSAGAVAALVVGFVIGYCCGRKCGKETGVHLPYPDTEYEYFEQRQGLARPMAPLLPTSSDKLDPRDQEEVTYAEPELVSRPLPPQLGLLNSGAGKYYDGDRFGSGGHYSSSLLQANKFNTIQSGANKRLNKGDPFDRQTTMFSVGGRRDGPNIHMSTLGRASMRNKSANNDSSVDGNQPQIVDSAYGTTRSVKKVYL